MMASVLTVRETNDISGDGNHPQGCSFSPDGLCVLTATVQDAKLRLYNTLQESSSGAPGEEGIKSKSWTAALICHAGEAVRSYDWYPLMKSNEPASCCFLATSRDMPIHLFDAYMGSVRASYCPYNALDEIESPTVAIFSNMGDRIIAGGFRTDRTIHVFQTARPGRDSTTLHLGKTRRSSDGQKGLVSSLACSPDSRVFAVGTYSPGSIYIYDDRTGQQVSGTVLNGACVVGHGRSHSKRKRRFAPTDEGKDDDWLSSAKVKWFLTRAQGGVTQLRFDPGGQQYVLYSASRRSNAILSWDLRMLGGDPQYQSHPLLGFGSYSTDNDTNQRLEFDLDDKGQKMYIGGKDGCVRIYDVKSGNLIGSVSDLEDTANGVSVKSVGPTEMLAVATGSRRFHSDSDLDDENAGVEQEIQGIPAGLLRLYKVG